MEHPAALPQIRSPLFRSILRCCSSALRSRPLAEAAFSECEHFGVNILRSTQQDISALFASKSAEKFDKADYEKSLHGTPVIKETSRQFRLPEGKKASMPVTIWLFLER